MLDIINYSNSDIVCSCGQIHKKSTQTIVWGSNAIDKVFSTINMFLTAGQILFIYDKKSDEQIINKIKSGFEGTNLIIKPYEAEPKEDNYKISEMEKIIFNEEDDLKIIIAYGDDKISRFARFTANMKNINYVMIPSTIGIDYLKKNSFFVIKGVLTNCQLKAPIALIVDTDLLKNTQTQYLAKAYSYIISAKITLAEYYFQGLKSQSFCSCYLKK
jgi:glycerol dehydrogenase-like iron-containing ADH family enzyme